jgi:hypothetical protein
MPNRRRLLACLVLPWALPAAAALESPSGPVVLTIRGRGVGSPNQTDQAAFDMAMLASLPQHRIVTETPWYSKARSFSGPLLREVLAAAGVTGAERARLVALNDYRVEVPLEDARRQDVIVARLLDDKPMSVREKGPLFVMYPFDREPQLRTSLYFSRCVWQLKSIELL